MSNGHDIEEWKLINWTNESGLTFQVGQILIAVEKTFMSLLKSNCNITNLQIIVVYYESRKHI